METAPTLSPNRRTCRISCIRTSVEVGLQVIHLVLVSAESADIIVDPLQRRELVFEPQVESTLVFCFGALRET
jgi:hypothetical protein